MSLPLFSYGLITTDGAKRNIKDKVQKKQKHRGRITSYKSILEMTHQRILYINIYVHTFVCTLLCYYTY